MLFESVASRVRSKFRPGGRFDPSVTADRLEALRQLANVDPKEIATVLWPNQKPDNAARAWWKRAKQKRQPFSVPEIEAAVDYLAAKAAEKGVIPGRLLPGFPFVDLWVAVGIERGK